MIFLTEAEVLRLTGHERPAMQLRWCRKNGVPVWKVNARGEPVIRRCDVEGGGRKAHHAEPDFDAIR